MYSNEPFLRTDQSQSYGSDHGRVQTNAAALESQQRQIDLIKEQQNALRSLQDQRRQLEAQRDSFISTPPPIHSQPDFLSDFLSTSSRDATPKATSWDSAGSPPPSQLLRQVDPLSLLLFTILTLVVQFTQFMREVESTLDTMNSSMKQLHLDIQLAANKQEKDARHMDSALQSLELRVQQIRQSPPPQASQKMEGARSTFENSFETSLQTSTTSSASSVSEEQADCPVCSGRFSTLKIHAHIESHFAGDSSSTNESRQSTSVPESAPGFWGRIFKKKEEPSPSLPAPTPSIQPPVFDYGPPQQVLMSNPQGSIQYGAPQSGFGSPQQQYTPFY